MKKLLPFALLPVLLVLTITTAIAQSAKQQAPVKAVTPTGHHGLRATGRPAVPPAANPFGFSKAQYRTMTALQATPATVRITRGENGLPIFFQGQTAASGSAADGRPAGERVLDYLASLQPEGLADPATEFTVKTVTTDEQSNQHVRLQQVFQGVPVYGGEMIAHTKANAFTALNGRYYPTPRLANVVPAMSGPAAIQLAVNAIGPDQVKTNWTAADLKIVGGQAFTAELVVYHPNRQLEAEQLAWHVEGHPNLMNRVVYFIDAQTGAVIHHFDHTCRIDGGRLHRHESTADVAEPEVAAVAAAAGLGEMPPVNATGVDLLGVNRTFGAWQQSGTVYLEDASKSMFNAAASTMPGDPVGVIVTLTGFNNSPQNDNFNYDLVTSGSTSFNNPTAVSAHYNGGKSFDYYQNTFGRNSIDGVGGNMVSFTNITEPDGSSLENAFWNGDAMFYGGGGSFFKSLARGLDVAGHEMTHGVVEKTANLEYQDESGALNESFADVFGIMIDRDDWQIGEDVMQSGVSPNGVLRDLQNPNNGDSPGGQFWQPKQVSEQYFGPQDNGGVHINSGIPNRAFYLFASNAAVGKDKAEQVYYKALRDYLVKSSQFVDARIAVIAAANDLYGSSVSNVAAAAFTTVGIVGSTPGGNYLGNLDINPGVDLVVCVTNDNVNLQLADGTGFVIGTMYNGGVKSRPSVTDNGASVVFVNTAGHIILIDISYAGGQINIQETMLSSAPEWRGAVISKDGRFLAGVTDPADDRIYIFDLFTNENETFFLYNPTYTQGQITGEVQYADVMEFDYSGEFLMYDAFNELASTSGEDLSYWDIGFVEFFNNEGGGGLGEFTDGGNAFITKLFGGLPENTSVGNPAFAKNSPYIIAFDFIDYYADRYDILGANTETGDYNVIVPDNGDIGWPVYTRLDDAILYQKPGYDLYIQSVNADKISPFSNTFPLTYDRQWGVWFGNGERSLMVSADEIGRNALALTAAPNPTSDGVRLRFTAANSQSARLTLSNLLGETVLDRPIPLSAGSNETELEMRGLPAGTYVARLTAGTSAATIKIVKQ